MTLNQKQFSELICPFCKEPLQRYQFNSSCLKHISDTFLSECSVFNYSNHLAGYQLYFNINNYLIKISAFESINSTRFTTTPIGSNPQFFKTLLFKENFIPFDKIPDYISNIEFLLIFS